MGHLLLASYTNIPFHKILLILVTFRTRKFKPNNIHLWKNRFTIVLIIHTSKSQAPPWISIQKFDALLIFPVMLTVSSEFVSLCFMNGVLSSVWHLPFYFSPALYIYISMLISCALLNMLLLLQSHQGSKQMPRKSIF